MLPIRIKVIYHPLFFNLHQALFLKSMQPSKVEKFNKSG